MQHYSFVFIFLNVLVLKTNGQRVNVTTLRGPLFGYHFDQGSNTTQLYYGHADVFLGVPYAVPPVGNLKFAKTQRLAKFPQSPYNATYFRAICPQVPYQSTYSLDCLHLNILTPNASSTTKYPVMVWIHGGGLTQGNGQVDIPGAVRNLVSRGVVLVVLQYRLGHLGFFTTFTDDFPPNRGMLDQAEALRFVQAEISNFGGDPTKVTIMGESAGAASVSAHTYSPLSQDLFHQAIMESGNVLTCMENTYGPTYINQNMAYRACNFTTYEWNKGNYSTVKNCLYNMDLQTALGYQAAAGGAIHNGVCWNFVQDDNFLPGVPQNLWKNRTTNKPVIIGSNRDEWFLWEYARMKSGYTSFDNYSRSYEDYMLGFEFVNWFDDQSESVFKALANNYISSSVADNDHMTWLKFAVDVRTGFLFTGPASRDIQYHLMKNNHNVYVYEFTYYSFLDQTPPLNVNLSGYQPVRHGAETGFIFMPKWNVYQANGQLNQSDINIANFFGESWTNFAKYGKPALNNTWKPANATGNNTVYYEIGWSSGMRNGFRALDQKAFNQILPSLLGDFPRDQPDYNNGSYANPCWNPTQYSQGKANPKKCYKIVVNATLNQAEAENDCVKYRGILVSIDNAFENNELAELAKNYSAVKGVNCSYFIGLVDKTGKGTTWTWLNGDTSTYRNWNSGYPQIPQGHTDYNVTVLNPNNGGWQNQQKDTQACYICQNAWVIS